MDLDRYEREAHEAMGFDPVKMFPQDALALIRIARTAKVVAETGALVVDQEFRALETALLGLK